MAALDSLVVHIRTDNIPGAGTDDQVFFDIGTRQWRLHHIGRNDFAPGATDTFDLASGDIGSDRAVSVVADRADRAERSDDGVELSAIAGSLGRISSPSAGAALGRVRAGIADDRVRHQVELKLGGPSSGSSAGARPMD
jgi:hypothetical protein